MNKKIAVGVIVATALAGCASAPPSQSYKIASYDKAWECATMTATRLGVRIITSSKESGSIFGQKNLDDVNISLLKKAGGVEVILNRFGNLAFIPTTGEFPQDFYAQYGSCIGG